MSLRTVAATLPSLSLIVFALVVAMMAAWINMSRPPDSIPEQWKSKFIDKTTITYQLVIWGLCSLGLTYPFSSFDRALATHSVLLQTTGNPFWKYTGDDLKVTDVKMNGVRVKMYEPVSLKNNPKRPVVVYMHGGGWVVLSPDAYEPLTSKLALDAQVVVVSIDYRLSPDNPYPGPRDDCKAVVNYLLSEGGAMGLDTTRVALAGDSAGGNLAASLALEFKKKVAMQIILVPALQAIDTLTPSAIENTPYMGAYNDRNMYTAYLLYGGLPLKHLSAIKNNTHVPLSVREKLSTHHLNTDKLMSSGTIRTPELRLPAASSSKNKYQETTDTATVWKDVQAVFTDPYFSPLLANDIVLRQTPPFYVVAAGYDIIRDDAVMYYYRLKQAGVEGLLKVYPEAFHFSMSFSNGPLRLEVGERSVNDLVQHIRQHL